MRKNIKAIALITLSLLFIDIQAKDIYISKTGNDNNDGSKESPVLTLQAARDIIRKYKQTYSYVNESFVVYIDEGVYEQSESFELTSLDSGTSENPVVWRAVPGKEVRISGGRVLPYSGFKRVSDMKVLSRLMPEARKNVYQISLRDLGIESYGGETQYGHALPVSESSIELILNDSIMTLSRYPNSGYILLGKIVDAGSVPKYGDYSQRGGTFEYTDERHERWVDEKDLWIQGTFNNGYADDNIHVEKIDRRKKTVKLSTPHLYGLKSGSNYQHYFVKNILEELDMPGEYYIDRDNGMLYFWNPEGWGRKKGYITLSMLEEPIISLRGVSHVYLENLIVESGRGIGIYMEQSDNNRILGCTVRNIGTSGIFMGMGARQTVPYITHDHYDGVPVSGKVGSVQAHIYKYTSWNRQAGSNNLIKSCDVYNTGSGGIYLSGGDKKSLTNGNNVIDNCRIHNFNRRNHFGWAGVNVDGCGNVVRHCEIFDSEFQGIYVRGNEHLFEYNELHHVTTNSDDTSPWYIGRDPSDCGNVIRYNYFHHCGNKSKANMCIYCDDSTADVKVFGNVFYNMNTIYGMIFSNSGRNLTFKNNIVINPVSHTVYASAHFYTWAKNMVVPSFNETGIIRERLTKSIDIYNPPYCERYPFLYDYLDPIIEGKEWSGIRMKDNVASNNLIVGSKVKSCALVGENAQFEWVNNWETVDDPGFVDMKNADFSLKEDSKVYKMIKGFKPVPFENMGIYKDEYRK